MKRSRIGSLVSAPLPVMVMLLAAWAMAGCGDDDPFGPDSDYSLAYLAQPSSAPERALLTPVVVSIQDGGGNTVTTATIPVTVALDANPGGGTLSGTLTVNAVAGVATFDDLAIDRPGAGYTLVVSAGALPTAESPPFDVSFVSALAVGTWHACVVRAAGAAYCWGYNSNGQLGDGSTVSRTAPVAVGGGVAFASIAPGAVHTCGLTSSGEAYCWGANSYGRLGDSTTSQRTAPTPAAGEMVFSSISAGLEHTCAVEAATRDAYCWGRNQSGQLGDGTTTTRVSPIPTFGSTLFGFDRVSAGGQHTCAIALDGAAYCWGLNAQGQLGDATTVTRFVPTEVSGGLAFRWLAVNNDNVTWESTCGVTADGETSCWGLNNYGQLGRGTTGGQSAVPAEVFGGLEFTTVSPGQDHTCAVTVDGDAYCWGRNVYGQLGNGAAGADQGTNTPTLVTGGLVFRFVGTGSSFSCGLTIDDEVYCWGYNGHGELGDGTTTNRSEPVLVLDLPVGIGG